MYAAQAKDPELKKLFETLKAKEQEHCDSLTKVLSGTVPECNCNDSDGREYEPKAAYTSMTESEDKRMTHFLPRTASEQKSWCREPTTMRCLRSVTAVSVSC